jgi:hypothetical protein
MPVVVLLQGLLLGLQLAGGGSTEVPDQDTMDYWMKVRGGGGNNAQSRWGAEAHTWHWQQQLAD